MASLWRIAGLLAALALGPFVQAGQVAETWSFTPARDEFRADALLDLRGLNEAVAGETGFVHLDAQGGFVRGDGKPIRFWAVNTDVAREAFVAAPLGPQTAPDLTRHARFLAKRGVNMVRLHRQLSPPVQAGLTLTDINRAERDSIWRSVAAMRREGIYSTISPYWAGAMKFPLASRIAGGADQPASGLLFFDPTLQAAYKAWLKQLLVEKNPYTGIALADDASVAILQIQNEDSLLFWTFGGIQGAQREALETRYAAFLVRKYASLTAAMLAWHGSLVLRDAPWRGRMALLELWELTQSRSGGRAVRLADQTEFLSRTMFDFNRMIVDYLRHDLGVKQLVNAGNWKTASDLRLNDAERWSYTPGEVDAVNRYIGGIHQGPNTGWAILDGDRFTSDSALWRPELLPINIKQTAGRPMLVTESAWVMPNAFGAEGPFLVSAYSSLTGVAGFYWFATGDEAWTPPQSANGYLPSQGKWLIANPDMLGSFPAAALVYRMGYLARGAPVVVEHRTLAELWERRTPIITEASGFDPNRDTGDTAPRSSLGTSVSPDAFLAGPVQLVFGQDPARSVVMPLAGLATPAAVRSVSGELVLNREKGYCTIDAPMAQGVAAHFSNAASHRLSDVSFSSANRFGAAIAVSLDGLPLRSSGRILVQYSTQSRPTGWQEQPARITLDGGGVAAGMEIRSYGRAPWQVARARLEVAIRNPGLRSATVLDMNGMAVRTVPLTAAAGEVRFSFPDSAMYVVLR